jgi:hypothetical protein
MTDAPPTIDELLRSGAREWNKRRSAGEVARDHTAATLKQIFSAGADLSELTLVGTEWEDCELAKVSFRDADLSNAYFHGGVLVDCNFNGANLDGVTFENLKLVRCDFSFAQGLDNIELTAVDTKQVEGLPDPDLEPRRLSADRASGSAATTSIEDIVARFSIFAEVEYGTGATEAEVQRLEAALATTLPGDYRAFLMAFGQLRVEGVHAFSAFGIADLEEIRGRYRAEFDQWIPDAGWRDASPPASASAELLERRAELREILRLPESYVQGVVGDAYDMLRIAYEHMIPVMGDPEELNHVVECIGPGGRIYSVSIKTGEVNPPRGTFTSRFSKRLEAAVREGMSP